MWFLLNPQRKGVYLVIINAAIFFINDPYQKRCRSSHPDVLCKRRVHKNFEKITGKHLCQSLFFKLQVFFIKKKEILAQVSSCEFCETFKNFSFHRTPPVAASECLAFCFCYQLSL